MLNAIQVAEYFLSKDKNGEKFNKNLREREGRRFYEGNARLNKYLHMAQNLYIAKTGKLLFSDNMYAYDNGAVVPQVQENYGALLAKSKHTVHDISDETINFLDHVYAFLDNAPLEELIELSHEDVEWKNKHGYYFKQQQVMDSISHADEYRRQYADALKVMEGMQI